MPEERFEKWFEKLQALVDEISKEIPDTPIGINTKPAKGEVTIQLDFPFLLQTEKQDVLVKGFVKIRTREGHQLQNAKDLKAEDLKLYNLLMKCHSALVKWRNQQSKTTIEPAIIEWVENERVAIGMIPFFEERKY